MLLSLYVWRDVQRGTGYSDQRFHALSPAPPGSAGDSAGRPVPPGLAEPGAGKGHRRPGGPGGDRPGRGPGEAPETPGGRGPAPDGGEPQRHSGGHEGRPGRADPQRADEGGAGEQRLPRPENPPDLHPLLRGAPPAGGPAPGGGGLRKDHRPEGPAAENHGGGRV